jgi:hypothetical protein
VNARAAAALFAIACALPGCAITGSNGTKAFGVFPVAAPEKDTVTLDKITTVAADVDVAGYGRALFGYQSLIRLRVPVLCLEDGRCFVPLVTSAMTAASGFGTGTSIDDRLAVGGFAQLEPAPPAMLSIEPLHVDLGVGPPP